VPATSDQPFARVLVRLHGEPLGFVTLPFAGDDLDLDTLFAIAWGRYREQINGHLLQDGLAAIDELTPYARPPGPSEACRNRVVAPDELVSVVVCTRNRSEILGDCLASLRMLTYPHLEVIVVDNAPVDDSTRRVVDEATAADPRFRYVVEPRPGLSCARNKGLAEARGTYIAYTDDDVAVDPGWVDGLVRGFQSGLKIACVTGLVCTARITTESEAYLDARAPAWSTRMTAEVFDLRPERGVSSLSPSAVRGFGTGANAAFDRAFLQHIGGFDEALGAGAKTHGGEDLDVFLRTLVAAGTIAYEPSALVWRHHRADHIALLTQMFESGASLSAVVTKCLAQPRTTWHVLRQVPSALHRATGTPSKTGERLGDFTRAPRGTAHRQLMGWAAGPFLYARARLSSTSQPWSEAAADTATARLAISLLSLGSLVTGATAFAVGADATRLGSFLIFCLLGVGSAPWQMNRALRLPARLTLTMVTSLAVLTLVSVAALVLRHWHSMAMFVAVVVVCVPLHLAGLRRATADGELSRRSSPPTEDALSDGSHPTPLRAAAFLRSPAMLGAGIGGILCLNSALAHRHLDPGFFGFLTKIGIAWYAGLALILVALALARANEEWQLAVPVVLLVIVLTLTPAIVYDGPRSQVAAKHVDLVLQIRELHRLDSAIEIYNAWPGFFGATAWLCDITGIRDPMRLATFWPPLLGLFRIAALRFLFGQVLRRPYQAWTAVALAVLADPIGADYFSPQSVGFVIGMAAIGLALSKGEHIPRLTMIFVAAWVLAVSHQLSPYTVGGALVVLVVFRQVRPWWTPLLVLVPALLWAVLHRGALTDFISWKAIGRAYNFRPPKTVESPGLERLAIVNEAWQALVLGIVIVGAIAALALLRYRRRLRTWALACCSTVGLVLVAINPYGQEGIFRAALFGIPWLAVLAAHCFSSSRRLVTRPALFVVTSALAGTFLVASFGLDAINVMRPSDVAAFRYFQQQRTYPITTHYVLALGAGDLPTSLPPQTGNFQAIRRDKLNDPVRQEPYLQADLQVKTLTERFLRFSREPPDTAHLYAVWSPVSSYYARAYGLQTPDQFVALRDAFRRSPYWEVAFHQDGTYLFRFEPTRYHQDAA